MSSTTAFHRLTTASTSRRFACCRTLRGRRASIWIGWWGCSPRRAWRPSVLPRARGRARVW
ncbi:hypothetical protein ACHAWF_016433, partial [Thalassiosira exigua]